ncbi:MFS transporter [Massilia sp. CCM 8694]|uniref:MFS transporter n=2 Tax=Massilia genomosp. 1 TaxID=2609280 RepID=A0ABX0MX72_9BURK|nr:MFS transporter [Massilia genomosp. 1]
MTMIPLFPGAVAAPRVPPRLVALFACGSGLSVANVYYAQPLLGSLAADFAISPATIGGVITATQAGSIVALLMLVPLGDRLDRRRLMLVQAVLLALALACVAMACQTALLLAGMLAVGLLGTAMTQGLIATAASAADASERGRVVGAAQGGVVIGLLLARVLAGVVADAAGWRWVYLLAAATMLALAALLWTALPAQARTRPSLSYGALLLSMLALLRHERMLQIRGVIALLMFAAFSIFWSALVLPLSAPPFALSHSAIGAFGLVGVAGALAAGKAGSWADRGLGQRATGIALGLLVLAWLPLGLLHRSLWLLGLGIVLLDIGAQAIQVLNQSMIFRSRPDAHSRLVGCYMLFYAVGSGAGALAATAMYAAAGWTGVCWLGAGVSALAAVFWALSLRWTPA